MSLIIVRQKGDAMCKESGLEDGFVPACMKRPIHCCMHTYWQQWHCIKFG